MEIFLRVDINPMNRIKDYAYGLSYFDLKT